MPQPYVYLITNFLTGEYYYGMRAKNVLLARTPEEDFWVHYETSSKRVKHLIHQYGKDSFAFEIVFRNDSFDACYQKEQELIGSHLGVVKCLNMYCRETNKFSTYGNKQSDSTKEKIRAKALGRVVSPDTIAKIKQTTTGVKKSPDWIANAAAGRTGKKNKNPAWNKGLTGMPGHPNALKGTTGLRPHTEQSRSAIGNALRGMKHEIVTCPHCGQTGGKPAMRQWHFDHCKFRDTTDYR